MNILVVAHYQHDGAATAIFIEAQIQAYVQQGHSVRVIVPIAYGKKSYHGARITSTVSEEMIVGARHVFVRYLSLSKFGANDFNTRCAIGAMKRHYHSILGDFTPDVIHAHTLGFDSELGAWLKKRLNCPLIVTTHGSDSSIPMEKGDHARMKEFCDQADCIVAVSSALANRLRPCETVTPIKVILNGFAVQSIASDEKKTEATILQVGSLQAQKRPEVTLRAFAELRNDCPDARLTFIGDGQERERLEALSRRLGVADAVRFTGYIPNPDVLTEMAKAQFFVLPSVREGFGIVYLEAMASGCITIGTAGEGIADVIRSGENGFLVPPDDPDAIVKTIAWCLSNQKGAAEIAEQGRKTAMELTWDHNAEQYVGLFQLLEKGQIE